MNAPAEIVRSTAEIARKDTDPGIRAQGLHLLWKSAPKHPDLVPQTLEMLDKPAASAAAFTLLAEMGTDAAPAVPELVKQLGTSNPPRQHQILRVLGGIGPGAEAAKPALRKLLEDPNEQLKYAALRALHDIRPDDARELLPKAIAVLKQNSAQAFPQALYLLGELGPAAAEAASWLVAELHRPQSPHLIETAEVLAKIDPDRARKEATPVLRALLHDSMRRIPAATLLQQLHPDGGEGLTALAENMREPNVPTRRMAVDALGKLGPAARSAAGALREALHDSSASVRMRAAFALGRVRGEMRTTLPILLAILEKAMLPAERGEAASYLGQIGPAARDALTGLRQAQGDPNAFVRRMAAEAIARIEGDAPSTEKRPTSRRR